MITEDNQEKSKVKLKQEKLRKGKANRKMKKKKTEKAAAVFKKSTAGTEANNNYKGTKKQRKVKVLQDNKKIFCQVCNVETNGNKNHDLGKKHKRMVANEVAAKMEGTSFNSKPEMGAAGQKTFSPSDAVENNAYGPSEDQAMIDWMLETKRNLANDHEMGEAGQEIFSPAGAAVKDTVYGPGEDQAMIDWMLETKRILANDYESPSNIYSSDRQIPQPTALPCPVVSADSHLDCHIKTQKEKGLVRICEICQIKSSDAISHEEHLRGKKHNKMLNRALLDNNKLLESRYVLEAQMESKLVAQEERLFDLETKVIQLYKKLDSLMLPISFEKKKDIRSKKKARQEKMETSLKPLFSNDNVDAKSDLQGKHGDQAGQEQIVDGVQDKQRNQAGMGQDDVSMVAGDKLGQLEDEVQDKGKQDELEEFEDDVSMVAGDKLGQLEDEVQGKEDHTKLEDLEDDAQDKQENQAEMGQDDVSMIAGDKLEEQEADVKTEVQGTEDQAGQEWLEDDAQDNEDDLVNHTGLTNKVETDPNHDYE